MPFLRSSHCTMISIETFPQCLSRDPGKTLRDQGTGAYSNRQKANRGEHWLSDAVRALNRGILRRHDDLVPAEASNIRMFVFA